MVINQNVATQFSSEESELEEESSIINSEESPLITDRIESSQEMETTIEKRNYFVCILTIFFGIGSWVGVYSTFLQLPLLVQTAPEKWKLPSYIEVINQMGNSGAIIYTLIQRFSPRKLRDDYMIYGVLKMGVIVSLLISFMYKKITIINGKEHSLSLFILFYCFALIGCTSSVLFMPYMGRFKEMYLITYFIGEGLSGFIVSLVGLIQGVGETAGCILTNSTTNGPELIPNILPARFDSFIFFLFVFILLLCSFLAFILLNNLKICKNEYATNVQINQGNNYYYQGSNRNLQQITERNHKILLILMACIAFFENGILASVQSFSCLPYGNTAYHLTVTLTLIANPIASMLALFLKRLSVMKILTFSCMNMFIGLYILATALLSPTPPLVGTKFGEVTIVICWTIFMGFFNYIKVNISTIMRARGGKSLVWTGAIAQTGSSVGAIVMFCIVNFTGIFIAKDPCS